MSGRRGVARPSPGASRHPPPGEGKGSAILEFARELRSTQTDAEAALWFRLRAHRFLGLQFKRQKPIGSYIVDFYCKEQNLVIEVDGSQHLDNPADIERDAWLNAHGLRVLRFWNNDVLTNIEAVLEQIRQALSPRCAGPSPRGGEKRCSPPLGEGGPKGRERA